MPTHLPNTTLKVTEITSVLVFLLDDLQNPNRSIIQQNLQESYVLRTIQ